MVTLRLVFRRYWKPQELPVSNWNIVPKLVCISQPSVAILKLRCIDDYDSDRESRYSACSTQTYGCRDLAIVVPNSGETSFAERTSFFLIFFAEGFTWQGRYLQLGDWLGVRNWGAIGPLDLVQAPPLPVAS